MLLFAESNLAELLALNPLTIGVFVEFLVASALLTLLVMDRIGAGQLRTAAILGGVGGTLFLVVHFVVGPMIVDLTRQQIQQVVLFAGSGTAIGMSIAVTMFRPSGGREQQDIAETNDIDIEP